jgi:hypothetical protein
MSLKLNSLARLLATVLCLDTSGLLAQDKEDEAASRVTRNGGVVSRDEDGRVSGVFLRRPITPLTDQDIEAVDFSVLSRLKSLGIYSPRTTNRSLVHLQKIQPGLRHLRISAADITDEELVKLLRKHRSSLTSLYLFATPITDRTLLEVGKMEKLTALSVRATKITDKGLKHLAGLQELLLLDLAATSISDAGLADITRLTNLSALIVDNTKVTNGGILQLQLLPNLERLYVSSTGVTNEGKKALQQVLPDLEFGEFLKDF